MLFINNLNQNGNESQKEKFLPKACAGEIICGLCMSESSAGTDVLAMNTFAQPTGESFILNGSKMWITNGTIDGTDTGDAFLVYAKTDRNAKFGGLTMFLVEKGMKGFRLGHQVKDKLGIRSSPTAELIFEDVKIPRENVVGKVGGATLCMMRNLELERLELAGMSLGIARRCIEIMSAYSQDRKAFGKPIQEFGQIQKAIAESYAEYLAGRSFVYDLARRIDLSKYGQGLDSDAVKLFCAPMAKRVADRAIQVLGGNGYVGEYVVERLWRDAKLMEIGGGTIEAHHKNLYRDMKAFNGRIL
jgi:isovaleryl-CoA dehydrogenase